MNWTEEMMNDSLLSSSSGDISNTTAFDYEDNNTLSCAARNIQGPIELPYSSNLVTAVRIIQSLLAAIVCLSGTFLNVLVIFLIAKYKKLQTLAFAIALHIAILDVVYIIILFLGFLNILGNRWMFGEYVCGISGMILFGTAMVRTYVMFVFVVDRFLSVFFPFRYPKHQIKSVVILLAAHWCIVLVAVTLAFVFDCYMFIPDAWICTIEGSCSNICSLLSSVFILLIMPASVLPIVFYAMLFAKARKAKKAMAAVSGNPEDKHDWKATITFFLMFITVFAMTIPNLIAVTVTRIVFGEEVRPLGLYLVAAIATRLISFQPVTDPIFILRNKDVREVLAEIKTKIAKTFCLFLIVTTRQLLRKLNCVALAALSKNNLPNFRHSKPLSSITLTFLHHHIL